LDKNKLKVLQSLPYVIREVCGLCKHAKIGIDSYWGTCNIITYKHEKHTGENRQLSIHMFGSCHKFVMDNDTELGSFEEFLEK